MLSFLPRVVACAYIGSPGRWRQEDHKIKDSLGYIARLLHIYVCFSINMCYLLDQFKYRGWKLKKKMYWFNSHHQYIFRFSDSFIFLLASWIKYFLVLINVRFSHLSDLLSLPFSPHLLYPGDQMQSRCALDTWGPDGHWGDRSGPTKGKRSSNKGKTKSTFPRQTQSCSL